MFISFPVPVLLQINTDNLNYPKSDVFNDEDWYLAVRIKDDYLIQANYTTNTYIEYEKYLYGYDIEEFLIHKDQTKIKSFEEISNYYIITVYSNMSLKEENKLNMIININEN